jgi:hypothetical protein
MEARRAQEVAAAEVERLTQRIDAAMAEDRTLGDLLAPDEVDQPLVRLVWSALQDANRERFAQHMARTRVARMIEAYNCLIEVLAEVDFDVAAAPRPLYRAGEAAGEAASGGVGVGVAL